jgi:signal transduction histidine kinase
MVDASRAAGAAAGSARDARAAGPLVVLAATAIALLAVAGLVSPAIPLAVINDDLDTAITGLAAGIAGVAALLQWNRFREDGEPAALFLATGLLVLAAGNWFLLVVASLRLQDALGLSVQAASQGPIYGWIVSRAMAASLFVLAGLAEVRGWVRTPRPPGVFAVGVATIGVLSFPVFHAVEGNLGILYVVADLPFVLGQGPQVGIAPGMTGSIILLNGLVAIVLLAAALLQRETWERTRNRRSLLLSYAFVIGALAQVHFAIVPPSYFGLVSAGDVLRVGFYAALLLVIEADSRSTLRELRINQARVEELRRAELAQALLEERSRLARDLHDGLAQELWLAKLRLGKLAAAIGRRPNEAQREAGALGAAIDSAIAEARLAVIAMNVPPGESSDLERALARYVADVAERLDLPISFEVRHSPPPLDVRANEEILRAVHEALHNVRKHADAGSAAVLLDSENGVVRVSVSDDGRGFDPSVETRGFGLMSIRERLGALGGRLAVESPGRGTRLTLEIPVSIGGRGGGPRP